MGRALEHRFSAAKREENDVFQTGCISSPEPKEHTSGTRFLLRLWQGFRDIYLRKRNTGWDTEVRAGLPSLTLPSKSRLFRTNLLLGNGVWWDSPGRRTAPSSRPWSFKLARGILGWMGSLVFSDSSEEERQTIPLRVTLKKSVPRTRNTAPDCLSCISLNSDG